LSELKEKLIISTSTMETVIFLLNHMLTYCITDELGNIVLKCKYRVRIEQLLGKSTGTTQGQGK